MSSIGSVDSSSSNVWIEKLLAMQKTSAAGQTSSSSSTSTTATTTSTSDLDNLQAQVKSAVSAALSKLDKSSSAEVVMNTVKSAVDDTLKTNGIDVSQMHKGDGPQGAGGQRPPPPPGGGSPPGGAGGGKGGDSMASMIDDLLKENGFDPDAIKQALAASSSSSSQQSQTNSGLDLLSSLPLNGGIDTMV
jgi:hypothetical protein